jgi:hypothetical protein
MGLLKGAHSFGDIGKQIGGLEFEIIFVDGDHGDNFSLICYGGWSFSIVELSRYKKSKKNFALFITASKIAVNRQDSQMIDAR